MNATVVYFKPPQFFVMFFFANFPTFLAVEVAELYVAVLVICKLWLWFFGVRKWENGINLSVFFSTNKKIMSKKYYAALDSDAN